MAPSKLAEVANKHKNATETERYLYALERPEDAAVFAMISRRDHREKWENSGIIRIRSSNPPKEINHSIGTIAPKPNIVVNTVIGKGNFPQTVGRIGDHFTELSRKYQN